MSLITELRRRNVLRVAAAYVVSSWLLIQVAETLFPLFGFGDEPARITVLVLVALFVPALVLAWVFEWTPQGLKREEDVDRSRPADRGSSARFDRIIMLVLAVAVAYFAVDKFVLSTTPEAVSAPGRSGPDSRAEPVVAVMPFRAMGRDGDTAFLANGIHEDLLTRLAQLDSLRVISRSSVEEYRETEKGVRQIGEELGATAILEGRIQSAGGRIRINVQLIDTTDDQHLWAETFDRELSAEDIFDVQAEIAKAVATSLQAALTTEEEDDRDLLPTDNLAAYRAYHEAIALRDRDWGAAEEYQALLRRAIELDPGFTRALAALVGSLALEGLSEPTDELIAEVEEAIEKIRASAPASADHLVAQAYYAYYILGDYELALGLVEQALVLRPSDPRMMEVKAWIERRLGDYDAMIESLRASRRIDPRNPRWTFTLLNNLMNAHRYDEAWAELQASTLAPEASVERHRATVAAYLKLREHRNFSRLRSDIEALYAEFPEPYMVEDLAFVRVADRDYEAALEAALLPGRSMGPFGIGIDPQVQMTLLVRWLLGGGEAFDELLAETRTELADRRRDDGGSNPRVILGEALLAALADESAEAERLVRRWNREGAKDWPDRVALRDDSCMILGIAGAADAAADCLRTGLEEPSQVTPYLDPYLAWYDGVRDDPVFAALVAEVEAAWPRPEN